MCERDLPRRSGENPDSESKDSNGAAKDPSSSLGDEVVSFQTLDDPDDYEDESKESAGSTKTPILGMLARERSRRTSSGGATFLLDDGDDSESRAGSQTFSPWNALPVVGAASVGRTVPVPPAVDGGLLGTIAATFVLGFEVMLAILSGPIFYVLRGVGRGVDRAFQPVPGLFGSSLKLLFFLALLFILGGLVALVAIFAAIS